MRAMPKEYAGAYHIGGQVEAGFALAECRAARGDTRDLSYETQPARNALMPPYGQPPPSTPSHCAGPRNASRAVDLECAEVASIHPTSGLDLAPSIGLFRAATSTAPTTRRLLAPRDRITTGTALRRLIRRGQHLLYPRTLPTGLRRGHRTLPKPTHTTQRTRQARQTRMLRRPPTTLTLTSEDIAIYEDKRAREAQRRAHPQRYDPEELASSLGPPPLHYHHNTNNHSRQHQHGGGGRRTTILDPPLAHPSASGWDQHPASAASPDDLRRFAAQDRRAHARGPGTVHWTPQPDPHGDEDEDEDGSDLGPALDSPPEALDSPPPPSSPSSSSVSERAGDDEDEDEDEEMADYDTSIPGQLAALPRSARPAHATLATPVAHSGGGGGSSTHAQGPPPPPQQLTPIPTAAASQIPQAPARRTAHQRTTSSRGGGAARGGGLSSAGESHGPPPAPPRLMRTRDERIGGGVGGTRRTGR
ncbi:hypothetical protein JX266_009274 [Neoarthrinium moseri]|nr:hypothetical protein JX266_009274 [Neoarthrinium moseri]